MYALFQTSGKTRQNYNLFWQTGSQSKQVPPTFKATNSCPPTTLPKTSKQSGSWAQASPPATHSLAACRSALQVLKVNQLPTAGTQWGTREEGVRGRGRGQRSTTLYICFVRLWADPTLSSDRTLCTTTYTASQGWMQGSQETCTRNDEMIHTHPQKWETAAQTTTLLRGGQRENAYLQGLNGSSMTKRGSGESSCVPEPPLTVETLPFLLSQLKMEAHAVWEPSQSSHWACAMT